MTTATGYHERMRLIDRSEGVLHPLRLLALPVALVLSAALLGCSSSGDGPDDVSGGGGGTTAAISSVNGASAPRAELASGLVIVGAGFGTFQPGTSFVRIRYDMDLVEVDAVPNAAQWTDNAIRVVVPSVRPGGGTFTTPGTITLQVFGAGVQSGTFTLPVDAQPTFTFAQVSWALTSDLPTGLRAHGAAAVAKDADEAFVYVIGGNDGAANVATVISNTIAPSGELGAATSWTAQPSLPEARALHDIAVADSSNAPIPTSVAIIYSVGGQPTATAALAGSSTIYFAQADRATGALSAWATTTPIPEPLLGMRAVVGSGLLFVTGGTLATGTASSKVYVAPIGANGALGAFVSSSGTSDLPLGVSFHEAVAAGGLLYVLGGDAGAITDPYANAAFSPSAQTIGSTLFGGTSAIWVPGTQGNRARSRHTVLSAFNQFTTIGGVFSTNVATGEMEQATVAPGSQGQISGWTDHVAGAPAQFTFQAAAVSVPLLTASGNPQFLLIGGDSTGTPGTPSRSVRRTTLP